jgi:hypothetical protein
LAIAGFSKAEIGPAALHLGGDQHIQIGDAGSAINGGVLDGKNRRRATAAEIERVWRELRVEGVVDEEISKSVWVGVGDLNGMNQLMNLDVLD